MAMAKSGRNWFAIGVSIAVVAALIVLGGIVVMLNNQATAPGAAPSGGNVNSETGAISYGSGETVVATYVDFICPACNAFEQQFGKDLQKAAANDQITLEVHPIAILDHQSQGTAYSSRAAAAMYCVAESAPDKSLAFFNSLFANQPAEGSTGLTDEQLTELANQAGAPDAAACIADGTFKKFPAAQAKAHEIRSTPTVEIDGKRLTDTFNETNTFLKGL